MSEKNMVNTVGVNATIETLEDEIVFNIEKARNQFKGFEVPSGTIRTFRSAMEQYNKDGFERPYRDCMVQINLSLVEHQYKYFSARCSNLGKLIASGAPYDKDREIEANRKLGLFQRYFKPEGFTCFANDIGQAALLLDQGTKEIEKFVSDQKRINLERKEEAQRQWVRVRQERADQIFRRINAPTIQITESAV